MISVLEIFGEPISFGGQESFVFNTIGAMNRENLKIDFLTPYYVDNPKYQRFIKQIDGNLYKFNLKFEPGKSRVNLIRPLEQFLKTHHYDVVHIHSGSISVLGFCALIAKKQKVKKVIVHSHMAGTNESLKHKILKQFMAPLFRFSATDFCAPTKEAGAWQFSSTIVKNKLNILRNGIDMSLFSFDEKQRMIMRKQLNLTEKTLLIGNVGRLDSNKNQVFLVKVFNELLKYKKDSKLLLIGDGLDYKKRLDVIIQKNHLKNFVIFTGNVNNVFDYMQAMDVFVFPSKFEGLGIVSIEAQGTGLPVVASNQIPKEIKMTDSVHFMSLNDDVERWASEILKLSKSKRTDFNLATAHSEYDIKNTSKVLRDLYFS